MPEYNFLCICKQFAKMPFMPAVTYTYTNIQLHIYTGYVELMFNKFPSKLMWCATSIQIIAQYCTFLCSIYIQIGVYTSRNIKKPAYTSLYTLLSPHFCDDLINSSVATYFIERNLVGLYKNLYFNCLHMNHILRPRPFLTHHRNTYEL